MADVAVARLPGSAERGYSSSRGGSRDAKTPGSAGSRTNAVKKWKRQHEQSAMLHLSELRSAKKVEVRASKENARKLARKIPVEVLAKEWLSESNATIEMRAYMVDKVLPTVILGVEKLLNEVDDRGLTQPEAAGGYDPNFNPINFLGQYLMRNNPRYSNFSEASPYVRGLRQIAEELRTQLFDMEDNRLARIKAEAKRKREEREREALLKQQEKDRRQNALMTQFQEWNVPTDNNRVELSLLQNALRSFVEVAEQFPPEIQEVAKFGHPLEPTDETGRSLSQKEFAQYLSMYIENLPSEVFEQFMVHMSKCARAYRASAERENRRIALTNLFIFCDHSGIGMLDRHRILSLFEQFWDTYEDHKKLFRNPRRWPVVEVDEVDDTLSDEEDEGPETIPETALEYEASESQQQGEKGKDSSSWSGVSSSGQASSGSFTLVGCKKGKGSMHTLMGSFEATTDSIVESPTTSDADTPSLRDTSTTDGSSVTVKSGEEHEQAADGEGATEGKAGVVEDEEKGPANEGDEGEETEELDQEGVDAGAESGKKDEEGSDGKDVEKAGEGKSSQKGLEAAEKDEKHTESDEEHHKSSKDEKTENTSEEDKMLKDNRNDDADADKSEKEIAESASAASLEKTLTAISEGDEDESRSEDGAKSENDKQDKKENLSSKVTSEAVQKDISKNELPSSEAEKVGSEKEEGEKEQSTDDAAKEEAKPTDSDATQGEEADKPEEEKAGEEVETAEKKPAVEKEGEEGEAAETEAEKEGEVTEKEKENDGQEEKEKDEAGADPELAQDVDITGEIAKSAIPPRVPDATPAGTGRVSITFAQGTAFEREKTGLTANSGNRSQSQMSAFDESNLNVSQFVQLTENFLGEHPRKPAFDRLIGFLREGYEETEDEKMDRLMKARKEAISANRKVTLDALFEKWDNDGSGYLDLDEVEQVMLKYKEGQEADAIAKAREQLKKQSKYHDSKLSRREFRAFVGLVIDQMPGAEAFEYFVDFLTNNVERSYAERVRGEARKKWLQQIITAAETSGIGLEPIYKAVFQSLYRDAEAHGGEKRVSASISLLEKNVKNPSRGEVLLRYVACTPEDADYVLNRALFKDMKGVSFAAVDSGKPVHVPRVNTHGNVHFWNTDRMPDEREGSFIAVPLKDRKKRVFGVLGVDTLCDPHSKAIFITHEIQYFQGVGQTFSVAYHLVDMKRKLLRITESAISWIKRRSPHVAEIMVYTVEPHKSGDFVLRRMMTTDHKGLPIHAKDPPVRLERKDNLFRDYLFKSVDNSETVMADAYGSRHMAFPLRNNEGKAIAVVDINISSLRKLPPHENKEMQRMLRLLQQAHKEITREFAGEDKLQVLDAEKAGDDDTRMDIMFDRLMLMELRENVAKLDAKAYAELKAYNSPPRIVLLILRASLAIFYPDQADNGEFDDWNRVKSYINGDLSQKVQSYDPTAEENLISPNIIEKYLKVVVMYVPHGEVAKHGSLPAQHLYNWVFVCLSLIEHTRKMRANAEEALATNAD